MARTGTTGAGRAAVFTSAVAWLYILLFAYTAGSKLMALEQTRLQMSKSPVITGFAGTLSWLVPAAEIVVCVMLVFPRTLLKGLYAGFMLMLLFTGYIIAIQYFSSFIPCSCGGITQRLSWTGHLALNLVFIVLAGAAIYLGTKNENKGPGSP